MANWIVVGAVLAFVVGVYIGIGAPGWPVKPKEGGRLEKRPINPIAWGGRSSRRERVRPGFRRREEQQDERRPRLR